jgi:hypothetical protein
MPVASIFAGMPAKPLRARDRLLAWALSWIDRVTSHRGKRPIGGLASWVAYMA